MGAIPPSSIPVIDLSELNGPQHDQVVESIVDACQRYGFFQVMNHAIPVEFLEELKATGYRFFNQSEEKKAIYTAVEGKEHPPVTYKKATAKDPVNVLFLTSNNEENARKYWPDICKENAIKYQNSSGELVEQIMRVLLNDLGVTLDESFVDLYMAERDVLFNHYPSFLNENPEIQGKRRHTDPYTLTVMLQDYVGGLFAKINGQWVEVQPIPEALIIIVGDMLEVISNGRYKAGAHYVQTGGKETRISIPLFVHPSKTTTIQPHTLAVERDGGIPRYTQLIYKDHYADTLTYYRSHTERDALRRFKISN